MNCWLIVGRSQKKVKTKKNFFYQTCKINHKNSILNISFPVSDNIHFPTLSHFRSLEEMCWWFFWQRTLVTCFCSWGIMKEFGTQNLVLDLKYQHKSMTWNFKYATMLLLNFCEIHHDCLKYKTYFLYLFFPQIYFILNR